MFRQLDEGWNGKSSFESPNSTLFTVMNPTPIITLANLLQELVTQHHEREKRTYEVKNASLHLLCVGIAKTLRVLKSRVSGRVLQYPVGSGRVSGLTYVVKNDGETV